MKHQQSISQMKNFMVHAMNGHSNEFLQRQEPLKSAPHFKLKKRQVRQICSGHFKMNKTPAKHRDIFLPFRLPYHLSHSYFERGIGSE